MAELKTKPSEADVAAFLAGIEDDGRRGDAAEILRLMKRITGEKPKMWGESIVGFGSYHYRYESGREGEWFLTGFSPRKRELTLYIMAGFERWDELMERLGRFRTGKSCLYIRRLEDVDSEVLGELIEASVAHMKRTYPRS
ncbi:MAG: DUF1801 domain-containing protein [Thermoanaerobaculia bacterium]